MISGRIHQKTYYGRKPGLTLCPYMGDGMKKLKLEIEEDGQKYVTHVLIEDDPEISMKDYMDNLRVVFTEILNGRATPPVGMKDVREAYLEIQISDDGKIVWLNSAAKCVARVQGIDHLVLNDQSHGLDYRKVN